MIGYSGTGLAAAGRRVGRGWARVWRLLLRDWPERRRLQLLELSDATLRDIGLSRADVFRESRKTFWR